MYFPLDAFERYLEGAINSTELLESGKDPCSFQDFKSTSSQICVLYELSSAFPEPPSGAKGIECLAWEMNCRVAGSLSRIGDPNRAKTLRKRLVAFNNAVQLYLSENTEFVLAKKLLGTNKVFSLYFALATEDADLASKYFLMPTDEAMESIIAKNRNSSFIGLALAVLFFGGGGWFLFEFIPIYRGWESWNSSGNKAYLEKSLTYETHDLNMKRVHYSGVQCTATEQVGSWNCLATSPDGQVSLAVQVGETGDWRSQEY